MEKKIRGEKKIYEIITKAKTVSLKEIRANFVTDFCGDEERQITF